MQATPTKGSQASAYKNSTPSFKPLQIERRFDVPVDRLFAAFTNAEALKRWWWPKGLHADRIDIDFREGGQYFINMKGFERGGGGMTGQFEEIVPSKRIVMTDQFADEKGHSISAEQAGMMGVWPEVIQITFDFTSLGDARSELKLVQEGIPSEMHADCTQGWSESFDKLEEYLTRRSD